MLHPPPIRVLVADDHPTVRDALGQLLIRNGYEVATAADGLAAVEVLKGQRIDALLLDLQMPRAAAGPSPRVAGWQ